MLCLVIHAKSLRNPLFSGFFIQQNVGSQRWLFACPKRPPAAVCGERTWIPTHRSHPPVLWLLSPSTVPLEFNSGGRQLENYQSVRIPSYSLCPLCGFFLSRSHILDADRDPVAGKQPVFLCFLEPEIVASARREVYHKKEQHLPFEFPAIASGCLCGSLTKQRDRKYQVTHNCCRSQEAILLTETKTSF